MSNIKFYFVHKETSNLIDEDHAPFFTLCFLQFLNPKKEQIVFLPKMYKKKILHEWNFGSYRLPCYAPVNSAAPSYTHVYLYCLAADLLFACFIDAESIAGSVAHTQHKFM